MPVAHYVGFGLLLEQFLGLTSPSTRCRRFAAEDGKPGLKGNQKHHVDELQEALGFKGITVPF